jgi:hypothetical protein
LLVAERQQNRPHELQHLRRRRCGCDCRRDERLAEQPRERHLHGGGAELVRNLLERLQSAHRHRVPEVALDALSASPGRRTVGAVLSGQKSRGQRVVRADGNAARGTELGEGSLEHVAGDQVVLGLQHRVRSQAAARGRVQRLAETIRRVVRGADRAHLASAHERVERSEGFVEGGVGVVSMGVVEVDAVDPQAA